MIPEILLSFDVEEFDMPVEYHHPISREEQLLIGKKGLDAIMPFLMDDDIKTTLFTTANFAINFPEAIIGLSKNHEIASHTFYHSSFEVNDLKTSRIQLEAIIHKKVTGLRMPRMKAVCVKDIIEAGYTYDASVHPTWLPGRYNNLHLPKTKYTDSGLVRIPAAVTPHFRIPLFWLSFKNFPYKFYKALAIQTLKKYGYLSLYFHPWEFVDIKNLGLPKYTTRDCGAPLLDKLKQLITDLKKEGMFITMESYSKKLP